MRLYSGFLYLEAAAKTDGDLDDHQVVRAMDVQIFRVIERSLTC